MATCAVRSFSSVPEATSDSDDEDKLHIVEEDSIPDDPDQKASVFQLKSAQQLSSACTEDADGRLGPDAMIEEIRVKEECVTEEEADDDVDEEVAGQEKQAETTSIYPDAPEEHQSTPERGVHDENGTPDAFSYLHTCPHCSRGYKRHTSLKEHIKLRHEKSDDNYCCSICSYTFTYRTQLVRHMTSHRHVREQRTISQSGGNRKFKCTECSKAFKYKHHLKEHLRIHSGEKPYECSNCQKRFSHSGSYSSHISSKKCAGGNPVNSMPRMPGVKADITLSHPTHILLREKVDITNKPLQEQLPLKQIKQEPVEHQPKAVSATPTITTNGVAATNAQGVVQTLVVPTVGLVQPISINLSDLQNVLNMAMDGNVLRQVLASANVNGTNTKILGQVQTQTQAVVLQPQQAQPQVISAISLPVVGQDGNAKIIINYSPQLDSQLNAVKVNATQPVVTQPTAAQAVTAQEKSTVSDVTQPKVVQVHSAQSNLTETQTSSILNAKPTQVNIIKPVQAGNPTKPTSIIRLTPAQATRLAQARAAQPKLTQQSLLLVRRADGTQSLVVRQVAIANPNTQGNSTVETKPTETKSTPEKTTNTVLVPQTERRETTENTSSLESDVCKQNLIANVPSSIKIKTEPDSPSKIETEMEREGEKDMETEGNKEKGKQSANNTVSHSGTVHSGVACGDNFHNYASCLLCDSGPSKLKLLDSLNGDTNGSPKTISLSSLLDKDKSGAAERLLPLLKAYSQDPHPTEEQLSQVAKSVKLPLEAVSKWYKRMRSKKILLKAASNLKNSQKTKENTPCDPTDASQEKNSTQDTCDAIQALDGTSKETQNRTLSATSPDSSTTNFSTDDLVIVKTEDLEEELQSEPLDLSVPKSSPTQANTTTKQPISNQKEPLNLACLKKQSLPGNTIYVAQAGTSPLNIVTGPLQTLVAIAEPGGVPCIGATLSTNKQTILIPQLTYTYTTNSNIKTTDNASAGTKGTVILNNCLNVADTASDCLSGVEDLNDEDVPLMKKKRKTSSGLYACNLCDKIFQKSSSLLRHKYEHTGKRPHACVICKKAFKHKHHLIEHTRLHSGEKPYQCDKCGKRFSHSGSYSQHMNHRYSYCKRDTYEPPEQNSTSTPPSQLDSDERESDGEEEEEVDFSGLDMSDIRVVRVGEEYEDESVGGEDDQESRHEEHETEKSRYEEHETEEGEMVMEVEPGDIDTLQEKVRETVEMEDAMETEESMEVSGNAEEDRNFSNNEENTEMTTEKQQNV
ncbi:zinc finger E-box-binding homeobox 1-like isoform X3 [Myxocyprinus asiaticus]|uniref:zinc finger E-box-binding homeobox 1-like isoform X3 n=1 Tax=Myxocyprinus asiaticus TaxID=70543 RepID=UPI0022217982|nr:zinc finger E-box-binding homeobox 1-like isoform X3 [Myxocyprinus asiaticus]